LLDPASLRVLVADRDAADFSKSGTLGGSFMY